jgi:hypothetical protein
MLGYNVAVNICFPYKRFFPFKNFFFVYVEELLIMDTLYISLLQISSVFIMPLCFRYDEFDYFTQSSR